MEELRTIIFVPTWKCNLNCSYCDYHTEPVNDEGYIMRCFDKKWKFGPELTAKEWLRHLSKLAPFHLEFTGGEPTVYSDFKELVANLPSGCTWAVTSNTLTVKVREIDLSRCKAWTASWHERKKDLFLENVRFLKDYGIVRITIVVTPDNFQQAVDDILYFAGVERIGVNVHPVLSMGFSWEKHSEMLAKIKALDQGGLIKYIEEVPLEWNPQHYAWCDAGSKYFALMPDGTVLRCYSALLWYGIIGHVSDFNPVYEIKKCDQDCVFHCDNKAKRFFG